MERQDNKLCEYVRNPGLNMCNFLSELETLQVNLLAFWIFSKHVPMCWHLDRVVPLNTAHC